ncbi:hypothetical protein [Streptomyces sp. NPDC006274]|uniref:hypothetical protein n=1 Tax=unclassified Streptomyces TaxID=2593676 RepID=UPI0033AC4CCB
MSETGSGVAAALAPASGAVGCQPAEDGADGPRSKGPKPAASLKTPGSDSGKGEGPDPAAVVTLRRTADYRVMEPAMVEVRHSDAPYTP